MALLGSLAFASPWILSALLLVPLAYLIIRAIPPAPRRLFFPATWLTRELLSENLTSKSAPWWLIALRLLMLIILILALSGPFMRSDDPITADADAILLIDNDWSSAADWDARKALAQEKLERLLSGERRVAIVPTAAPAGGWSAALPRFETAGAARQRLGVLSPRPWSPDYAAVAQHLAGLRNTGHAGSITYITNGIDHGEAATLIDALKQTPAVDIIALKHARLAQIAIAAVKSTAQGFDILLLRTDGQGPQNVVVAITDRTGTVLARMPAAFERGAARLDVSIEVMPQVRSRVARLAIEGARHAGATYIFDARAQRPLVGLVAQSGAALVQPLQTPDYYLSRALQPFANLQRGEVTALLKQDVSVLLLPDQARLPEAQEDAVLAWVQRGGLLLRFAGPNMFAADTVREDALLPAGLRAQPRIIGGALSWSKAQPLAEFAADSPFYGVALAQDIAVEQHALMRSGATAQAQIWARLVDGTPLVSARSAGTGTLVLFHTSANATWSNLALSGTFVEMLQRILELSVPDAGRDSVVSDAMMLTRALTAKGTLAAATSNDGSGQLPPIAKSVLLKTAAGPLHPPGIYEGQRSVLSLNLASAAGPLTPRTQLYPLQEAASGLPYRSVDGPQERSLAAPLFTALLCLAFIDMVVTLLLNGTLLRRPSIPRFQRGTAALVVLLASACLIHPQLATAQTEATADLAENVRLACLETGSAQVDALCLNGINALSQQLNMRTSVLTGSAQLITPGRDDLGLFPLIYWPVVDGAKDISRQGYASLQKYFSNGGMLVLDLGISLPGKAGFDMQLPAPQALADIRRNMSLPPLETVTSEHVLTHSFYILKTYPGRRGRGTVWVEAGGQELGAAVSPIVIGAVDWLSAWASVRSALPGYAKGDGRDGELAMRFGINLVMYALTGTYKADQVHLPALLERVGRGD